MKITDLWKSGKKPTLSFELLPAKTPNEEKKFSKPIGRILDLSPDFVSITFGAGGATRGGSLELADRMKNKLGQEVLAYFAGFGLGPADISTVLDEYQRIGIENILAVRGDTPRDLEDFQPHPDSFPHASDLLAHIRPKYSFCLGAAGYPEGHVEAESKDRDIEYLSQKIAKGAEFVVCNYFYDNRFFLDFRERCRDRGIDVPMLPGIMPIYSIKMMNILSSLCGATIPASIREGISDLPEGDKDALVEFGIEFATAQCRGLLKAGVPGLHFYTMNRAKSVSSILANLRGAGLL